jgi:hypothetical protein
MVFPEILDKERDDAELSRSCNAVDSVMLELWSEQLSMGMIVWLLIGASSK